MAREDPGGFPWHCGGGYSRQVKVVMSSVVAWLTGTVLLDLITLPRFRYYVDKVCGWILELSGGKGIPFEVPNMIMTLEAAACTLTTIPFMADLLNDLSTVLRQSRVICRATTQHGWRRSTRGCRRRRRSRPAWAAPSSRSWSSCAAMPRGSRRRARPGCDATTSWSTRWLTMQQRHVASHEACHSATLQA